MINLDYLFNVSGIDARVARARQTLMNTCYDITTMDPRQITRILPTLQMHLGIDTSIEIGKGCVSIKVPKAERPLIQMRHVLGSCQAYEVPIGIDENGQVVKSSLEAMVHLLVAGQTGSGKSIALKSIISGLAALSDPEELKFFLIDLKGAEFEIFAGLPHVEDIAYTPADAIKLLKSIEYDMLKRYQLFRQHHCSTLEEYNQRNEDNLHRVVVVVDEFARLILDAKSEVELLVQSLAQMSRACGIHLVIATQTPRASIISGKIRANLPSTLAFKTRSGDDSNVAIGEYGCESLIGNGDGYYLDASGQKTRFQGCYVTDKEIRRLVASFDPLTERNYSVLLERSIPDDVIEVLEPHSYQHRLVTNVVPLLSYYEERVSDEVSDQNIIDQILRDNLSIYKIRRLFNVGSSRATRLKKAADQRIR